MTQELYTVTITPGFSEWTEPVRQYVNRVNYGPDMTIYTIDGKNSAIMVKKRLEREGYIVHIEEPNGNTFSTIHRKVYNGIIIG